ncbi:MAG TPA: hypothetical protein VJ824_10145, partial [Bacillota bacterium]|nr:hypothetical protein [Bacillota bacterium]
DVVRLKGGAWEPWYQYLPPKNTSREEQVNKLLKKNFIVCSTVMVRKNLLAKTGLFNENYPRHQDYDMWLRMLAHTKFGSIREVLLKYRWHDQNISRSPAITPIRDHMIEEAKKRFGRI